jgi:hypothetical protein
MFKHARSNARMILTTAAVAIALPACGGLSSTPAPEAGAARDAAPAAIDAPTPPPSPDAAAAPDLATDVPGSAGPDASDPPADAAAADSAPDSSPPDRAPDRMPDGAAPDAGPALEATVRAITASGDLCPEGSTTVSINPTAFTVIFSEAVFNGDGTATPVARSCRLDIEVEVPAGYQFSSARFGSRGAALTDDPPGTVLIDERYAFDGQRDSAVFSTDLSGRNDDYLVVRRPLDLWSPSCGASRRVHLLVDLKGSASANDVFALDTLDGAFTVPEGLEWRRCGERDPIRPPPSPKDGLCEGVNKLSCQFGLICEFEGEVNELGKCVDPTERLPPQPKLETCGGHREITCADGLVCRFASPRSVAEKRLGYCLSAIGQKDDSCGGYPAVPCAPNLTCFAESQRCVQDDGERNSPCGDGLRACKPGLTCNGSFCDLPRAAEGQPCGGPMNIQCRRGLTCTAGTCRRM